MWLERNTRLSRTESKSISTLVASILAEEELWKSADVLLFSVFRCCEGKCVSVFIISPWDFCALCSSSNIKKRHAFSLS